MRIEQLTVYALTVIAAALLTSVAAERNAPPLNFHIVKLSFRYTNQVN
jgi:hypothetical protein